MNELKKVKEGLYEYSLNCLREYLKSRRPPHIEMVLECAIFALETQIPKEPIGVTDSMFGDVGMICPNCKQTGIVNVYTRNGQYFNYCPYCGQALKD